MPRVEVIERQPRRGKALRHERLSRAVPARRPALREEQKPQTPRVWQSGDAYGPFDSDSICRRRDGKVHRPPRVSASQMPPPMRKPPESREIRRTRFLESMALARPVTTAYAPSDTSATAIAVTPRRTIWPT